MGHADAFVLTNRRATIDLAAHYRGAAIYGIPTTAAGGSLIYYRLDILDLYRQAVSTICPCRPIADPRSPRRITRAAHRRAFSDAHQPSNCQRRTASSTP